MILKGIVAAWLLPIIMPFPVYEEGSGERTPERLHTSSIAEVGNVSNEDQLCPCRTNTTDITATTEQAIISECCCQFENIPAMSETHIPATETPCCCQKNQADEVLTYQDHSYSSLVNWDATNFEYHISADAIQKRQSEKIQGDGICPDGWSRYKESCYYIEMEKVVLAEAELRCYIKNSTLFVANSIEEWNVIRKLAPLNFFSWIGLVRFADSAYQEPAWQVIDGIDANEINWLGKPYSPALNGWTQFSRCVAHYNSFMDTLTYAFFYNCRMLFYSICERNATYVNMLSSPILD